MDHTMGAFFIWLYMIAHRKRFNEIPFLHLGYGTRLSDKYIMGLFGIGFYIVSMDCHLIPFRELQFIN